MRRIFLFLGVILVPYILMANNTEEPLEVTSEIKSVNVFFSGAQINREGTIDVPKGTSELIFKGLSPYLNEQSIQVKTARNVVILSVNHQHNYLGEKEKTELDKQKDIINDSLTLLHAAKVVLAEEDAFLKGNQHIAGEESGLKLWDLREINNYYKERMREIKLQMIDINHEMDDMKERLKKINLQLQEMQASDQYVTGEIVIKIDAAIQGEIQIDLSYLAANAGWYPIYDLRVQDVTTPVDLAYKAKVFQNTGEDWDEVQLYLTNANPDLSGDMPEMYSWYVNSGSPYAAFNVDYRSFKDYNNGSTKVSGRVVDAETGEPLPFANVLVVGTNNGTTTDINGYYALDVPYSGAMLKVSYIGYTDQEFQSYNGRAEETKLSPDVVVLESVVVSAGKFENDISAQTFGVEVYDMTPDANLNGGGVYMDGINYYQPNIEGAKRSEKVVLRQEQKLTGWNYQDPAEGGYGYESMPKTSVESATNVEFKVDVPYTIKSNGEEFTVALKSYRVPAFYEYHSTPRLDEDAFLLANIINWEKLNLLTGEASLYYENTFVGKTLLDVDQTEDTLQVSLGRDQNIVVKREKIDEFNKKGFAGAKRTESRGYTISMRNNKSLPITMVIHDQIPISSYSEVTVNPINLSYAEHDEQSGFLTWRIQLQPQQKEELTMHYEVRYPKKWTWSIYLED